MSSSYKRCCHDYGIMLSILVIISVLTCLYVKPDPSNNINVQAGGLLVLNPRVFTAQSRGRFIDDDRAKGAPTEQYNSARHSEQNLPNDGDENNVTARDNSASMGNKASREWKIAESEAFGRRVQERIYRLQNPPDCHKAKRIVCDLTERNSGFGHYLHYIVYCMMLAHTMGRTMVLKSVGWRYVHEGWEDVFLSLSDTCTTFDDYTAVPWGRHTTNTMIVAVSIAGRLAPRPRPNPNSIPRKFVTRIRRFHGDPLMWWVGQYVKYATLLRPSVQRSIDESRVNLGYQHPIVGVHVRRSDRAAKYKSEYHSIHEYMSHVQEFYKKMSERGPVIRKRVYLATDDPSVTRDLISNYTDIEFITDTKISESATLRYRYSKKSLIGAILDIHLLSMADYIIGDISSNVCRTACELKQTQPGDASRSCVSLGRSYFVMGADDDNNRPPLFY